MKRKLNFKMVILTSLSVLVMLLLGTTNSKAALQSNPTTYQNKKIDIGANFIKAIREMEAPGQTMGLNEQIDETTLVETTASNNIDVHMMKSTEYGAIAILAISGFGNSKRLQDSTIKSTTGNNTGVYIGSYDVIVAASTNKEMIKSDEKYYNLYDAGRITEDFAEIGDALGPINSKTSPGTFIPEDANDYRLGGRFFHSDNVDTSELSYFLSNKMRPLQRGTYGKMFRCW